MESKKSRVFRNRNGIPNPTQQLDGILESTSPSPGPSNWSSQSSNHNILGQLERKLVVKDTIKTEIESPHRESDQKGYDMLNTDKEVAHSNVKMEAKVLLDVKDEPRSFSVCSNACDKLGQIKVESLDYVSNILQTLDAKLEYCVKPKPGCSAWSSDGGNMLRQSTEELVVKNAIKAEMKSPHRESNQEGYDTLNTDIEVTYYSDVKMEAKVLLNVKAEPRSFSVCSEACDKLGQIKVESLDYASNITQTLDGKLEFCVKPKPGCSAWSSNGGDILRQSTEELVVKDTIKAEMKSPQRERDHERNGTHYTNIDVKHSDVKKEAKDIINIAGVNSEGEHCSNVVNRNTSIRKHLEKKEITCLTCKKCFGHKLHLNEHMLIHSAEKPFSCSICRKSFLHKSKLERHTAVHSKEKPFSCSICSKSFSRKSYLKSHMSVHSVEKPFSCSICSKIFSRKSHLNEHMLVHSVEKPFSCSICSKSFLHKSKLERHMLVHSEEKPFCCSMCSKFFGQKSHLKEHMLVHSAEKPFSCAICSKSFLNKSKLERHTSVHSEEKPFSCSICSKCFSLKSSLNSHMMVHSKEKPFSCSICSKCFRHKSRLEGHIPVHSEEKPFSCSICSKFFSQKSYLKTHMLVHSVEKPFSCSVCCKLYSRKSCLKSHMLVHSLEKPFSCSICSKLFRRKSHLKEHMLIHSEEKTFLLVAFQI